MLWFHSGCWCLPYYYDLLSLWLSSVLLLVVLFAEDFVEVLELGIVICAVVLRVNQGEFAGEFPDCGVELAVSSH